MRHFYMINRNESFVEKESQWYRYRLSYANVEKCKLHLAVTQCKLRSYVTLHVLFSQEKIHWSGTSIDKIYSVMLWGTLLPRGREIIWTKLDGFLQIKDVAYKFIDWVENWARALNLFKLCYLLYKLLQVADTGMHFKYLSFSHNEKMHVSKWKMPCIHTSFNRSQQL